MPGAIQSFSDFWPEYVLAHCKPLTRAFHFLGTFLGWALLVAAFLLHRWWLVVGVVIVPYGLAWTSHFLVEHNRPATFDHPLWSFLADQKMLLMIVIGRMNQEVRRCAENIQTRRSD